MIQNKILSIATICNDDLRNVTGGMNIISPETVGCAIGGASLAETGPWGAAAGCVAGGAIANAIASLPTNPVKKMPPGLVRGGGGKAGGVRRVPH